jgi:HSP20 family protein
MFFAPVVRTRAPAYRSFDRSFERFVNDAFFGDGASRRAVEVTQDEQAWTVSIDVPGIAREELAINVEGAVVRIDTKAEAKRQFKAAYELPQDIDVDATSAKLDNGVLTLRLAKKKPVSNARQIEVR